MEFRQLEFFVLLAQELHFGRTAELLHIGQPALSQQIRRLEREVGTSLFDRTSRRVVLTPTGELFLAEARRLLQQAERALDVGRSGAAGRVGRLRFGVADGVDETDLGEVLTALAARAPGLEPVLVQRSPVQQASALLAGDLDVGWMRLPMHQPGLHSVQLRAPAWHVYLTADHDYTSQDTVYAEQLTGQWLVLPCRTDHPDLHDAVLERLRARDAEPAGVREAGTRSAALALVAAGFGLAVLPSPAGSGLAPRMRAIPVKGLGSLGAEALVWGAAKTPALSLLLDVARAHVIESGAGTAGPSWATGMPVRAVG